MMQIDDAAAALARFAMTEYAPTSFDVLPK